MITSIITYQFKGLLIFKVLGIIQSKRLICLHIYYQLFFLYQHFYSIFLTQADQMLNNFYNSIIQMLNNII